MFDIIFVQISNILTIVVISINSVKSINKQCLSVLSTPQLINPFKNAYRPNQRYHSIVFHIVDNSIATRISFLTFLVRNHWSWNFIYLIIIFINLPAYFKTSYNYYIIMKCKSILFYILYFNLLQNFNFPKTIFS